MFIYDTEYDQAGLPPEIRRTWMFNNMYCIIYSWVSIEFLLSNQRFDASVKIPN